MSVLAVGMSHRTADLALLERAAVSTEDLPKALNALTDMDGVLEAVVLSTCNRVEVYAHVSRFHPALERVRSWLSDRVGTPIETLERHTYVHYDDAAAAHLFAVASGIDSMIVGERQVAAQVRDAAIAATEQGTSARTLNKLFRDATRVSRRVRAETDIEQGASSIVDVGIDIARAARGGSLADATVLVVGAGTVGTLAARRLHVESPASLLIYNRTAEKAARLSEHSDLARPVEDLADGLRQADVVVCTTDAANPIIDAELIEHASPAKTSIVILDLAVPRNVASDVAERAGVRVFDLDAVRAVTDSSVTRKPLDAAREIVREEAARFSGWTRAVRVEPTIRALRHRADEVRAAELKRLATRLADLTPEQRSVVDALLHAVMNSLLHEPTTRLKHLADGGGAEHYANALRELFDLDE